MKKLNTVKFLLVALLFAASSVNGQTIQHPLAFGPNVLSTDSNYYKDYVGLRFAVTAPAAIAADYINAPAGPDWPNINWADLYDVPVVMPGPTEDSCGCTGFAGGSMAGKIALIWRGPLTGSGPCTFGAKAYNAQLAGALAIIIINEYTGAGPFAPGYTAAGTITIPVFMIGNYDGQLIDGWYHATAPGTVKMTITHWGQNKVNDLGFVTAGTAAWHAFAYPANQMSATASALKGLDGAFIANYGSGDATSIKLTDTLTFTPSGSSTASTEHTGAVNWAGPFRGTGQATPANRDSIEALFSDTEFGLTQTVKGRYDLKYTVSSSFGGGGVDSFMGDNTKVTSFYLTDSLYSKGRYDFLTSQPVRGTAYGGGLGSTWGNFYYVGPHAGTAIEKIQYSLDGGTSAGSSSGPLSGPSGSNDVYVFKWVDGDPTLLTGNTPDSIMESGELELVSWSTYTYDGLNDSSGALLTLDRKATTTNFFHDETGSLARKTIYLEPNTWYYVAIDIPDYFFLGVDGLTSPYPRIYGRYHANGLLDYSNVQMNGNKDTVVGFPTNAWTPLAFPKTGLVKSIDSFNYRANRGIIPAIAMLANNTPDTTTPPVDTSHVAVNTVTKAFAEVDLYPNPAKDFMNVSVKLDQPVKTITYKIIDGLGRLVSKVTHYDVQNEVYTVETNCMGAGNYYLLITADNNRVSKKFTVLRH